MKQFASKNSAMIVTALLSFLTQITHASKPCTYTIEDDSAKVQWQAFKTTEKLGVKGKFTGVSIKSKSTAHSMESLLTGLKAEIDLLSASTDNEARDKTLKEYFFSLLKAPLNAHGLVTKVDIGTQKLSLRITLNGVTRLIPMNLQITSEQNQGDRQLISALGKIDILNFKGSDAFNSLHNKCLDLHKGKDGESKTWSEVEITLQGTVNKNCR